MRLPDDYEDHGSGLTPTVVSAIQEAGFRQFADRAGGLVAADFLRVHLRRQRAGHDTLENRV